MLVLGDGFLELLELLATGARRQDAMTRSYNHMLQRGVNALGMNPAYIPPGGYRHGTECINGLANDVHTSVKLSLAGALPPLPPGQTVTVSALVLFGLCWQVEAMRHHVVYGMPLGVAAQLGLDVAAGKRQPNSRRGHTKAPLDVGTVIQEVRSTRMQIEELMRSGGAISPT